MRNEKNREEKEKTKEKEIRSEKKIVVGTEGI